MLDHTLQHLRRADGTTLFDALAMLRSAGLTDAAAGYALGRMGLRVDARGVLVPVVADGVVADGCITDGVIADKPAHDRPAVAPASPARPSPSSDDALAVSARTRFGRF